MAASSHLFGRIAGVFRQYDFYSVSTTASAPTSYSANRRVAAGASRTQPMPNRCLPLPNSRYACGSRWDIPKDRIVTNSYIKSSVFMHPLCAHFAMQAEQEKVRDARSKATGGRW